MRVLSRVTGSRDDILKQSSKRRMEMLVSTVMKEGEAGDVTQALIETGAIICVPNGAPLCDRWPFFSVCAARELGLTEEIPVKTPKKKRKIEEKTVLLLEYREKIAIRKRKDDGLLASLYEFINLPEHLNEEDIKELAGEHASVTRLPGTKHIFSHTEWHMEGYFISVRQMEDSLNQLLDETVIFAGWDELKETYAIPSAFAAYKNYLEKYFLKNHRN